ALPPGAAGARQQTSVQEAASEYSLADSPFALDYEPESDTKGERPRGRRRRVKNGESSGASSEPSLDEGSSTGADGDAPAAVSSADRSEDDEWSEGDREGDEGSSHEATNGASAALDDEGDDRRYLKGLL